ncbi:hypothetical protein B0J11DRAFT_449405 [Dendryphion nanum]|uniref:Rhodopsin domain-containing protein n=1 Tax=Dendryphion nanum TaxID=256645 RepID=A0A9P9CXF4_9PLEO|nr:hypothetical protein B0J11DRAFT_449405 [Dendryphion nanum]
MEGTQQPPPGGDTSNTTPGLVGVSFLFTITLIVYGVRIYTRIRPTFKLAAPDYFVSAALVSTYNRIVLINLFAAISLGLGHYEYYLSPDTMVKILKHLFALGFAGFWASSLARISIGSMLLRFEISNTWRVVLKILIFTQLCLPSALAVVALLQCRPIRAMWEHVPGAVCWSPRKSQSYGYVYSAIGMLSDLVFAAMPLYFIWSLHRPVMERILISILMTLGTLAAMAEALIICYTHIWIPQKVSIRDWMPLFWWYRVEEIGLIAAACAPFLKPLVERILGRFGASRFRFVTMHLNSIQSGQEAAWELEGAAEIVLSSSSRHPSIAQMNPNPGQGSDRTSSERFSHASDVKELQREQDCAKV